MSWSRRPGRKRALSMMSGLQHAGFDAPAHGTVACIRREICKAITGMAGYCARAVSHAAEGGPHPP